MFGQRLRLARKKAGLSLRELAKRLPSGLSAQAIGSYEAGRMMPRSAVLVELGRALDVSLDFLMGGQIEVLEGIEFRKHSRTSAKDRARVEALVTAALEDYLAVEEIVESPAVDDPLGNLRCEQVVSFDEVEQKAEDLRHHWSLGSDPISSMTGLLETRGFRVIAADLPERFHGLACGAKRRGEEAAIDVIVVSCRTTVERKRLTLAHELAHRVVRGSGNENIKLEKAMHRFAGAFLVPKDHLRAEVGAARRRLTYVELMRLKRFYGISASAMLIRLRDVGILPAPAVEYAFRTFARSWRKSEPEPSADEQGLERPARFERLVWQALAEELIAPVRAAQLLGRAVVDVEREIRGPGDR